MFSSMFFLNIFLGFTIFVNWNPVQADLKSIIDRHLENAALNTIEIRKYYNYKLEKMAECSRLLKISERTPDKIITGFRTIYDDDCNKIPKTTPIGYYLVFLNKKTYAVCIMKFLGNSFRNGPFTRIFYYHTSNNLWVSIDSNTPEDTVDDFQDIGKNTFKSVCDALGKAKNRDKKYCFETIMSNETNVGKLNKIVCPLTDGFSRPKETILQQEVTFWPMHDKTLTADKLMTMSNPCVGKDHCSTETIKAEGFSVSPNVPEGSDDDPVFVPSVNLVVINDPKLIQNYNCVPIRTLTTDSSSEEQSSKTSSYAVAFCSLGACEGDDEYCKNFGCSKLNPYKCTYDSDSSPFIINYKGTEHYPKNIVRTTGEHLIMANTKGRTLKHDCGSCVITCEKGNLEFQTKLEMITELRFCKLPLCLYKDFRDMPRNELSIQLPRMMVLNRGILKLEMGLKGNDIMIESSIMCDAVESCDYSQSWLSWDKWLHASCYTIGQIGALIIGILLFLLIIYPLIYLTGILIIGFIMLMIPIIMYMFRSLHYLGHLLFVCCSGFKERHDNRVRLHQERRRSGRLVGVVTEPSSRRSNYQYSSLSQNLFSIILFITILISVALACDKTTVISITQDQCVASEGGTQVCAVTTSTRIAVSPVGQTSCFLLKKDKQILGNIQVKTQSIQLSCIKDLLYYIPDVKPDCSSVYNCQGAGTCSMDFRECNNPAAYQHDIFGFQPKVGWSSCKIVTASGNCFYQKACFHVMRQLLLKSKNYAEAYKCSNWRFSANVEVTISKLDNVQSSSHRLTAGLETRLNDFTLNLVSVSTPPSEVFSQCFLKRGDHWSYSYCNGRGESVLGKLGEIQCSSQSSAESDLTGCLAMSELVTAYDKNQFVDCAANYMELDSFFNNRLPMNHGDYYIYQENDTPNVKVGTESLLEVQFDSQSYQLTMTSDMNQCVAHFVKLVGCYSCTAGATLSLEVSTNFGTAVGEIECFDVDLKFPIRVTNVQSVQEINVHLNQAEILSKCKITCPGGDQSFEIRGLLEYIPIATHKSDQLVSGIVVEKGFKFDFDNLFKITWFKYSFIGLGSVTSIATLCFMYCFFVNCCGKKKKE